MLTIEQETYIRSLATAEGLLEPSHVIEAAKNISSPLHKEFEWDDAKAAQTARLQRARELIRLVKFRVVIEKETIIAPYFVPDPSREAKHPRYLEIAVAGQNPIQARQVMLAELDRIYAAIKRAQSISVVLGLDAELEALLGDVDHLKRETEKGERQTEKREHRLHNDPQDELRP